MLSHVKFHVGPTKESWLEKIEMVSLNMLRKLDLRVSVVTRFVNSSVIIFILHENNITFNFCLNCHSVL